MLIRREGTSGERRSESLARRLEIVADIRRREMRELPQPQRYEATRYAGIEQHQHRPDAA